METIEIPVPDAVVKAEVDAAIHDAVHGLDHDEDKFAELLESQGSSREEFEADAQKSAERSVKIQLLLDSIAEAENTQVGQEELTERIIFQAQRYGIAPEQFIQQIQEANQLGAIFADIRRGKALASIVDRVSVSDTEGNSINTAELFGSESGETIDYDDDIEVIEADDVDALEAPASDDEK